jgi:hypothetical protein
VLVLHRDADRDSGAGVSSVVKVIAVIGVHDIHVIVVVPVVSPVFRPRVNGRDPIAAVLEARICPRSIDRATVLMIFQLLS